MLPTTQPPEISHRSIKENSPFYKFLEQNHIEVKSAPAKPKHHHHHHHHHRNSQSFTTFPNNVCSFIYRVWTIVCVCNRGNQPKSDDGIEIDEDTDTFDQNTYHSGIITRAYLPMRLTLMALGRWPFLLILKSVSPRKGQRIMSRVRVLNYDASLRSPIWIYFGLTTLFIFFVLVMSALGFFDFFLEWNFLPLDRWAVIQKNTFRNNLVMFLLVWGCLLHSTVSSFSMFIHRKAITRSLNYWNVAAEELQISDVRSHRRFLVFANLGYVLFLVLIYFAYSWWNIRFVRDGATLFGTLAIRPLLKEETLNNTEDWKLRVFGIFMIMYCVYASRAFLFLFCFKCRLLRTMFRVWNQRLTKFLERRDGRAEEKEKAESERILREMTILLKMVRQQDAMFATVLQCYYAVQLLNMCFEFYMLAQSGTSDFHVSDESTRGMDIVSALITLFQNVYFFFTVSLDGAYVGEEAAEGFEVIRRHPVTPTCSVHKKYLVYHLSLLYSQRIALTGGKFFTIDRPFIITVLGAVLTYFVIILQAFKNDKKGGT